MTAALIIMTIACFALGLALLLRNQKANSDLFIIEWERDELISQLAEVHRYCDQVASVINRTAGGLSKRITDNIEMVETIHQKNPDFFKQEPRLINCLHANDQFFVQLYLVVKGMSAAGQQEISQHLKSRKGKIFESVYASNNMAPPKLQRLD